MQTAPVCHLPDDVLRKIFQHGADTNSGNNHLQFQKVASRVCSRFRSVALGDALLWSKVKYVPNEKNMFVKRCIELSKSALLDIEILVRAGSSPPEYMPPNKPEYEEFFSLVNRECFRWRSIEITIPVNWLHICIPLYDRNADTRCLVHIALVGIQPVPSDSDESHVDLLSGAYPALREIKLAIPFPSWNWTHHSVTRLELGPFHTSRQDRRPPSYKSLFQMLKSLESTLEYFALQGTLGDSPHEETTLGTLHFKSLRTLLFSMSGEDARRLLAVCSFERVQTVDLRLSLRLLSRERFHSILHRPNAALFSTARHLGFEFFGMLYDGKDGIVEAAFPNITDLRLSPLMALDDGLIGFLTNAWPSISSLRLWEVELPRLRALLEARRQRGHPRLRKVELETVRGSLLKSDFDRISSEVEELTIKTVREKTFPPSMGKLPKFGLGMLKSGTFENLKPVNSMGLPRSRQL
ncbi:hypothetical protein FRC14_006345 [Serendipita sp. 396]|nr:hypothetical protein FRC14_006345 [Serendipita sp. 396]KAG8787309.1 hypothetical protein FRC15_009507 [Serendipita sp. 397]KAG8802440.1 hypothetical protein FRC16_009629 [Serendipita sp. 398]KAG8825938.1 hypothetical protein FRC19_010115 [Serendipita sp. 401]KAG8838123.1 hypothetical protein FRC18_006156 [Serendipita sp. 400]KAG8858903.1 hypothetical protein FRB91_009035 [Serendipita sp. 411]KAG8872017.1 hypothetical protein FRC20_009916 [Serendipita sp. 405]KAG9056723.1 hypothetical prot